MIICIEWLTFVLYMQLLDCELAELTIESLCAALEDETMADYFYQTGYFTKAVKIRQLQQ